MVHHVYAVVANAAIARLLRRGPERSQGWSEIGCLRHPAARQHESDSGPQRHGAQASNRSGLAQRQSGHQHERQVFARQVHAWLQEHLQDAHSRPLVVLASNPFLGELLAQIENGTGWHVHSHHAVDLTALPLNSLNLRLQEAVHL